MREAPERIDFEFLIANRKRNIMILPSSRERERERKGPLRKKTASPLNPSSSSKRTTAAASNIRKCEGIKMPKHIFSSTKSAL